MFPFVTRLLATALAVGPENVRAAHIEELALAAELKDLPALMSKTVAAAYAQLDRDRNLAFSALGLLPGQRAVVTNGKVACPLFSEKRGANIAWCWLVLTPRSFAIYDRSLACRSR